MPSSAMEEEPHLILIEKLPLTQDGHLIMHFPPESYANSNVSIRIESLIDPNDKYDLESNLSQDCIFSASLSLNLYPGTPYR